MIDREHFGLSTTGVFRLFLLLAAGFWLSACASVGPRYAVGSQASGGGSHVAAPGVHGTMKPYAVAGQWYTPAAQPHYNETGIASWYGGGHEGRTTANGELFDTELVAAAHKTLPLPCYVEVTNLDNGKRIRVRVNDRGPFVDGRIIDLTHAGAVKLGYAGKGTARVRVRYLGPADANPAPPLRVAARPVFSTPAFATEAPSETGAFAVQAGAFSQRDNAERAALSLGHARVKAQTRGMVTLYRVVLGPLPDERAANDARDQAARHGFPGAKVIHADF